MCISIDLVDITNFVEQFIFVDHCGLSGSRVVHFHTGKVTKFNRLLSDDLKGNAILKGIVL